MRNSKRIITSAVIFAGIFGLSAPVLADWRDRNQRSEYREDLRDLRGAQRELRRDFRRGAGPREIARDRAAIARERGELRQYWDRSDGRQAWSRHRGYRHDNDRYRRWNRWDRRDRGWHRGWWR